MLSPASRALLATLLTGAVATLSFSAPPDPGAARPGTDEAAVMEVVNGLFDAMRARDGEAAAALFHPEARLVSTGARPDGTPTVQVMPTEAFVRAVGGEGDPWNEPIFDTEVRIDGNLAQVWTFYRFYAGETFSHCGFNSILLVRQPEDSWKIVHLADTRRTVECERD